MCLRDGGVARVLLSGESGVCPATTRCPSGPVREVQCNGRGSCGGGGEADFVAKTMNFKVSPLK